ncbi:hypothetical protein IFR05_014203 [Cadophora sp. M221]|nr:hypothetical protein IFR05_014203 [Cadophora sp. M221]
MSSSPTNAEPNQPTDGGQNKSMTWDELRMIHPNLPERVPIPTRSVECNSMSYTDGEGVGRQIWIPKGTLQTASMHFYKKNWDALAKWPTYVDQGYADEGEAEEKERKTWEWLVIDSEEGQEMKGAEDLTTEET